MRTFIKVIEVWVPTTDRRQLQLADGLFGEYLDFEEQSRQTRFDYDEGLPGKAWSRAYPQIITDLTDSYFLRKQHAHQANLTAGIALPIFSGEFLLSVVVFLCGDKEYDAGAIELWGSDENDADKLSLVDGYYGSLNLLARLSRRMSFAKGVGLPGNVWDYNLPIIINEPANSPLFLRRGSAENDGVNMAFAMPYIYQHNELVLSFLSTIDTPIANRFEIWVPERNHTNLFFHSGFCNREKNLLNVYRDKRVNKNEGILGQTWLSGCPQISRDLVKDNLDFDPALKYSSTAFTLPVLDNGLLRSIVVLYF